MNFKQTPHPEIENHYHIQDLINGQEKRTAIKVKHQEIEKKRDQVLKDIAGFKDIDFLDFYCKRCEKDFCGRAKKQVDSWRNIAYYKLKHRCGNWCIRHITNREKDPYYYYSKKVAKDRGDNYKNLIQPFESGFNLLYGKK